MPAPPYSSSTVMPSTPRSPNLRHRSIGNALSRSIAAARGAISSAAKASTVARSMSAASPRSKFRPGSRFGNDAMLEQWPTRRGAPSETCSILVYDPANRGRNSDDSRAHADRGRAGGRCWSGGCCRRPASSIVFGISGGHTGRIVSGLRKYQNSLRMVLVREESLAGVMAEVYGRLTRRPGVMIGQGPWVLGNGLIGTIEAFLSSSPMLLLTDFSDATRFHLHAPYQQATGDYGSWDARRAFSGVTKQVMQAHEPVAAVQATQLAIKHALAGPAGSGGGAVRAGLAGGHGEARFAAGAVSDALLSAARRRRRPMRRASRPPPQALLAAERPVVIAGNGVRIAQGYDAAASRWPRRRDCRWRRPPPARAASPRPISLALGVFGTFGTEAANACVAEADLVLAIGTKLGPERHRLGEPRPAGPDAPDLHPDRHRAAQRIVDLPGRARADRRRRAGPAAAARGGCDRMQPDGARPARRGSPAWREQKGYFNAPAYFADDQPILPQRVIGELMRNLPDNAIVTCDAGENRIMMTHFYQTKQAGGFLQAAGSGPMGFAIPGGTRGEAGASGPAGRRGVRRRRVCDDDERPDDRDRAGHPDHQRGVQQPGARLGAAWRRAVRGGVRRLRSRRDRPRHGLPRRARRRIRPRWGRRCARR